MQNQANLQLQGGGVMRILLFKKAALYLKKGGSHEPSARQKKSHRATQKPSGKRYDLERDMEKFHGNQFIRSGESGGSKTTRVTRSRIADERGVSEGLIRSSAEYSNGVDAAETGLPGIRNSLLSGEVNAFYKDAVSIGKLPTEKAGMLWSS